MSGPEQKRNTVERLAEEFLARYRKGEMPSPAEYAARYPELAAGIGEVFPALVLLEEAGPEQVAAQLELLALIDALNDDQAGHGP